MMDIITELKKNERPLILLSDAEMAFVKKSPAKDFIWIQENEAQRGEVVWDNLSSDEIYDEGEDQDLMAVLRLRPDYAEKPEIVECEVVPELVNEDYMKLKYRDTDGQLRPLSIIPDGFMLCGFKFEGIAQIINKEFGYSHNGIDILPFVLYDDLKSGRYQVHYATHVLFQRKEVE